MSPCLVIGTPRSRTAWLAAFLTTPKRIFHHEPSAEWSNLDDLRRFLADDSAAACDSVLTLFWREAIEMRPDLWLIVVRRRIPEIAESSVRAGHPPWNADVRVLIAECATQADAASRDPGVLGVTFDALRCDAVCAAVYRFVHGTDPPRGHVAHWQPRNVQRPYAPAKPGLHRFLAERRLAA